MGHHHHVPRPGPHDGLDVIFAYGNRQLPALDEHGLFVSVGARTGRNLVECRDGYRLSVIAGPGTACRPRPVDRPMLPGDVSMVYRGPYTAVEVASCSDRPEPWPAWEPYAHDTDTVGVLYTAVPVVMVRALVDRHGGFRRMSRDGIDPRTVRRAERALQRAQLALR